MIKKLNVMRVKKGLRVKLVFKKYGLRICRIHFQRDLILDFFVI